MNPETFNMSHAAQFERIQQPVRNLGRRAGRCRVDADLLDPQLPVCPVVGRQAYDAAPAEGEDPIALPDTIAARQREALDLEQPPEVGDGHASRVGPKDPVVQGATVADDRVRHHAEGLSNPSASES